MRRTRERKVPSWSVRSYVPANDIPHALSSQCRAHRRPFGHGQAGRTEKTRLGQGTHSTNRSMAWASDGNDSEQKGRPGRFLRVGAAGPGARVALAGACCEGSLVFHRTADHIGRRTWVEARPLLIEAVLGRA